MYFYSLDAAQLNQPSTRIINSILPNTSLVCTNMLYVVCSKEILDTSQFLLLRMWPLWFTVCIAKEHTNKKCSVAANLPLRDASVLQFRAWIHRPIFGIFFYSICFIQGTVYTNKLHLVWAIHLINLIMVNIHIKRWPCPTSNYSKWCIQRLAHLSYYRLWLINATWVTVYSLS